MTGKNINKFKIKKNTLIVIIFFIAVIVQSFTVKYESVGIISQLKYIICIIGIIASLVYMNNGKKIYIFKDEFKNGIWIVIVFAVISLIKSIYTDTYTIRTIIELIFLLIPILYSYCLLNTLNLKRIDRCMFISLIISLVGYFNELNLSFSEFFSGITSMSFVNSYSLLESSNFAGVSIVFCMYFIYFKDNKIGKLLSILFVIFTFKRLAILFMLFLLFVKAFFKFNRRVNKTWLNIIKISVFILGIIYYLIMIPNNVSKLYDIYNIDLYKITMARTYRFKIIYNSLDFINCGLGSTYAYTMPIYGVTLEMDIIKLLIEITPIGVFIFINNLANIAKKNWYCMTLMLFQFFNMITSHSLASTFSWLFFYITIGCIIYKKDLIC